MAQHCKLVAESSLPQNLKTTAILGQHTTANTYLIFCSALRDRVPYTFDTTSRPNPASWLSAYATPPLLGRVPPCMCRSSTVSLFPVCTPTGADKEGDTASLNPEVNDSDILFLDACMFDSVFFCLNTTVRPGGARLVWDTGLVLSSGGVSFISSSTVIVGSVGSGWGGKASLASEEDWVGVLDVEVEVDTLEVAVSCRTGTQPSSSSRLAPRRVHEIRQSA